ncbi:MAG TPA: arylesterase [Mucilaginibacter sp.]|nr:arylesterase [Mucilaginibacter sp.]
MQNILFFGDSLTAGYGLRNPGSESFPALISQKIAALKLDYNVINAGLSGDTSAGGVRRMDYWLNTPIDIFVLELGVNDIIRGVSPAVTRKNLQQIIDKVKAKYPDVKIALMGMRILSTLRQPLAEQFGEIYTGLAKVNQIPLLPFFLAGVAGKAHLNLTDRLHPNADGYKIIAANVWPVIAPLLS